MGSGDKSQSARRTESVWDYPRPPIVESDDRVVKVMAGDRILAETTSSVRVLETSHPPVFYIADHDVDMNWLLQNDHVTVCEFKGRARYYDLCLPSGVVWNVAWTYPDPNCGFEVLAHRLAFYPGKADCFVDGLRVVPQEGDFYGGWITPEIEGPFKGGPGTTGW